MFALSLQYGDLENFSDTVESWQRVRLLDNLTQNNIIKYNIIIIYQHAQHLNMFKSLRLLKLMMLLMCCPVLEFLQQVCKITIIISLYYYNNIYNNNIYIYIYIWE